MIFPIKLFFISYTLELISFLVFVFLLLTPLSFLRAQEVRYISEQKDVAIIEMLAKDILIALDQANRTGNYSVLRDLGSPNFVYNNSTADLSAVFQSLRHDNLDLSPVIAGRPKFVRPPEVGADGYLRVEGNFPTFENIITFQMMFEAIGRQWKLYGLEIAATTLNGQTQAPPNAESSYKGVSGQAPRKKPMQ